MNNFTRKYISSNENIILALEKTINTNQNIELKSFKSIEKIIELIEDISFLNKYVEYDKRLDEVISNVRICINQILDKEVDLKEHYVYYKRPKSVKNVLEYRPLVVLNNFYLDVATNAINIVIFDRLKSLISKKSLGNVMANYKSKHFYKPYFNQYKKFMGMRVKYLSENKFNYVLLLDVKKFYERISFNKVRSIILKYFGTDDVELLETILDFYHNACSLDNGLPQGLTFSHFFASLLTYDLHSSFKETFPTEELIYYVDDLNVFFNSKNEEVANRKMIKITDFLEKYFRERLIQTEDSFEIFNSSKTNFMKIKDDSNFSELMLQLSAFDELRKDSSVNLSSYNRNFLKDNLDNLYDELRKYLYDVSSKNDTTENKNLQVSSILEKTTRFVTYREILLSNSIQELESKIMALVNNDAGINLVEDDKDKIKKGFFDKSFENYIRAVISICNEFNLDFDQIYSFIDRHILSRVQEVYNSSEFLDEYQKFYSDIVKYIINEFIFITKLKSDENSKINKYRFAPSYEIKNIITVLEKVKESIAEKKLYVDCFINASIVDDKVYLKRNKSKSKLGLSVYRSIDLKKNMQFYFKIIFGFDFCLNRISSTKKKIGQQMKVYEYRILNLLSNNSIKIDDLIKGVLKILNEIDSNTYDEDVDPYIDPVISFVRKRVYDSKKVDSIIVAHHYVRDLWKNGAKDLPFFTLHNHEHSLELILKLSEFDVKSLGIATNILNEPEMYVLILSIYLHDLGMLYFSYDKLRKPKIDKLSRAFEMNQTFYIASNFQDYLKIYNRNERIERMISVYNNHRIYRSSLVRENHAYNSRMFEEIDQIVCSSLGLTVKNISENHGLDVAKMNNQDTWVDGKKIDSIKVSHYLRFLDGLDTSRRRVSINLYNFMSKYVSSEDIDEYTMTHWAKHLITEDIKIRKLSSDNYESCNNVSNYGLNITKSVIFTIKFNELLPMRNSSTNPVSTNISVNNNGFFAIGDARTVYTLFDKFIEIYFKWTIYGIHELNKLLVKKYGVCIQVNFKMQEDKPLNYGNRIFDYLT